jgi:GTPase SAR1 family protein
VYTQLIDTSSSKNDEQ